jgi:hypothetical protein
MKAVRSLALTLLSCAACGGGATPEPGHPPAQGKSGKPSLPFVANPGFSATRLAVVPGGTFGPYLGVRSEGMVAAWAAEVSGKRHWLTVGIGSGTAPKYEPKTVADAAPEEDLVAVRPIGGGSRGFALLSSSREFSGERVDVIALGTKGELIGGPSPLAQSLPSVVWVDAVPTASGAIAMWAVRRDDRADIVGVELSSQGAPKLPPTVLVSDARAWQVAPAAEGVSIAVLTLGKGRNEAGPLKLFFVDAQAKLDRRSVVISDGINAEPDVDLAKIGDRLVVVWSDKREGEPRLYGAVADTAGTLLKQPVPLGRPYGPQSVLRIVPPQEGDTAGYLAWENLIERPNGGRAVRVATLSADGVLGDAAALVQMASPDSVPELVATSKGVAALTLAAGCRRNESCAAARAVPTFVLLDKALDVVASEPLRLAPERGESADLAWGLTCRGPDCTALAISTTVPAPVYLAQLGGLSNDWTPAARRVNDAAPPRVVSVEAIGKSEPLIEVAAARLGSGAAIGWLTDFDPTTPFTRSKTPAPDGKYEPPRAVLRIRRMQEKAAPIEPAVLSYRADSPGGVAIAPGDLAKGLALVAWVGIDNKVPQGFVTLVGPDGKKVTQKMITHAKTGVSDITAAYVNDGWVVAWIDEGANASEVHVAKIDPTLRVVVPERRVGAGGSTSTAVQLLPRGEHVFAVWSDAPGSRSGASDIFAARLTAKDLTQVGPEHPLVETPARSRSPVLAAFGQGAVVGWVEDSLQSGERTPATLSLALLDSGAEPIKGSISSVAFEGSVEGVGLDCTDVICEVAASVSSGEGGSIQAFEWKGASDIHATKLVTLRAQPHGGLAPVVSAGEIFYADQGLHSEVVIRRLGVEWHSP